MIGIKKTAFQAPAPIENSGKKLCASRKKASIYHRFFAFIAILGACLSASGQVASQDLQSNREEIRRRQQAGQVEQESRMEQPRVDLQRRAVPASGDIPDDPGGIQIDRVVVGTAEPDLPWLRDLARKYEGRRLGMAGIQEVIRYLSNACIESGYVTTRILLPEQDIATTRTLKLVAIPGVVGRIYVGDQSDGWGGTWWNAFPTRSGKMLNIRDIEQGLEQMKRVPTQDVTMELKPGAQPGQSDVVITRKNKLPIRGNLGIDNSGDSNTGKWQGSATAMWDNPLFLNDLLAFTCNGAVATSSGQGATGNNLTYGIPFGYWTAFGSCNTYDYHQTVHGFYNPYESSGKSRGWEARLQYLAHRDQTSKTSIQARLSRRKNRNFMDGVELEVQRRNTTALEFALLHQRNINRILLDASIAFRTGVKWLNPTRDIQPRDDDAPTNFYTAMTADAMARIPFSLGPAGFMATTAFRAQITGDTLYGSEYFSIGSRYTVRGFDGRQTLGAEKGLTLRNDIGAALWKTGQTLYAAIDYGYVSGPGDLHLPGKNLLGCAIGLRGGWKWFYYDATVGGPLCKPDGFHTASTTCAVQAGIQF